MNTAVHRAFLALGSNLGDPAAQLVAAVHAIAASDDIRVVRVSALYQSPAWPPASLQPDYVNAVIEVATPLAPIALWRHTSALEIARGRVRGERNAARTLDIDVLLYDDVVCESHELTLPHPRMHQRAFVLVPLIDVAPHIHIPGQGQASACLARISTDGLTKIGNNAAWNSMSFAT